MLHRTIWLAAAFAPAPALAEPAPPDPFEAKPSETVGEVVVTAAPAAGARGEIDRRSYDAAQNLQAQTGTLADLLRTVPSVDVDAQGNVSLRGDAGVVITIDGKPSGLFQGEGRASAVQGLPADQFERVEVITNPSAADSPEGVSGVINLVSRKGRGAGVTGSTRISASDRGLRAVSANAAYNSARLALSGELGLRLDDPIPEAFESDRRLLVPGGELTTRGEGVFDAAVDVVNGRLRADYDIDAKTRVGLQVRRSAIQAGFDGVKSTERRLNGVATSLLRIHQSGDVGIDNGEVSASLSRKLGVDQELTADLRRERAAFRRASPDRALSAPPPDSDAFVSAFNAITTGTTGMKADYRNPLATGELKAGYDGRIDRSELIGLIVSGESPAAARIDPLRSGVFDYRLQTHAAYATLSRKTGDLTVLGGLRLEDSRRTIAEAARTHALDLVRLYPSLHLSYPLDDSRKLTASYSRRVERPPLDLLNPLEWRLDEQTFRRGNPALRPQETDSLEVAYDARKDGASLAATLFYRRLTNAFTEITENRGAGALLLTFDNLGEARRAGLSLALTRPLTSKLSLNVSGDGYRTELPVSQMGVGQARSGWVVAGRGSLTWTPTPEDLFQLDGRLNGRSLTPQGRRSANGVLNLGYRRKLTQALFVNATAQNLLDSNVRITRLETHELTTRGRYEGLGRTLIVALTYNFGGGQRKASEPGFDFSGGGGGGGPP